MPLNFKGFEVGLSLSLTIVKAHMMEHVSQPLFSLGSQLICAEIHRKTFIPWIMMIRGLLAEAGRLIAFSKIYKL